MRKVERLELVKSNSSPVKTYRFDTMLDEHGHYVLKFLPYHSDINAIEYVFADMKDFIRKKNIAADINMEQLFKLIELVFENITVSKWKNCCKLTEKLKIILKKRRLTKEICDPLVISVADDNDHLEFSSDDFSSEN